MATFELSVLGPTNPLRGEVVSVCLYSTDCPVIVRGSLLVTLLDKG